MYYRGSKLKDFNLDKVLENDFMDILGANHELESSDP